MLPAGYELRSIVMVEVVVVVVVVVVVRRTIDSVIADKPRSPLRAVHFDHLIYPPRARGGEVKLRRACTMSAFVINQPARCTAYRCEDAVDGDMTDRG